MQIHDIIIMFMKNEMTAKRINFERNMTAQQL